MRQMSFPTDSAKAIKETCTMDNYPLLSVIHLYLNDYGTSLRENANTIADNSGFANQNGLLKKFR